MGAGGTDLAGEAARLAWAQPFTPVPQVLGQGRNEAGSWLVTAALPGQNAAASRWRAEPWTAVRAIGEGLRALHDCLPADTCPFSWSVADRLADIRNQVSQGRSIRRRGLPPSCRSAPAGRWSAHVDFGALGIADRWADLAIATWSTGQNYGRRRCLSTWRVLPDHLRVKVTG